MSNLIGLHLQPLDVLFFRDGRPFQAASRGTSGRPMPQTMAGALRTAILAKYGCDFAKLKGAPSFAEAVARACPSEAQWISAVRFRGPWFCRQEVDKLEMLFPTPATLLREKKQEGGELIRSNPLRSELPGWCKERQHGLRPLWSTHNKATEPADGYLTGKGMTAFLSGKEVSADHVIGSADLFDFDHRTGIGIDADRLAAAESQIYGASFLALKEKVGLYAEAILPSDAPNDPFGGISLIHLGGEGRRATLQTVPGYTARWPSSAKGKPLLLLITPGLFAEGWRPASLRSPKLVASAVPGYEAVSGWDLAKGGPKPTRFAAAAGTVYYLDSWLDGVPDNSLSDDDNDRSLGWGNYLRGDWFDA